ncbi:MAG: bifunctional 4-hydroxy-2-oxoglutarate aldolase/2-dehydro-3-deoxy-phosphogluconate aldolase [Phycisphaerales bacterium]
MSRLSSDFVEAFRAQRASAILRTDNVAAVAPAVEAAIDGGFRIVEFTLNTPGALQHIASFAARGDVIVTAGTVLTVDEANAAMDAGAACIVSPVVDELVIEAALRRDVAVMPGTHTPTEMLRAHRAGAPLQKLFPAPDTGPKFLKAVLGPMPFLNVVPTNGVHENNAQAWLKAGAFALGFVNTLFDPNDMAEGRFDAIKERAQRILARLDITR